MSLRSCVKVERPDEASVFLSRLEVEAILAALPKTGEWMTLDLSIPLYLGRRILEEAVEAMDELPQAAQA